jgi:hypothetical protein
MVADAFEAPCLVARLQCLHWEVLIAAGGAAVNHDQVYLAHVLVFQVSSQPITQLCMKNVLSAAVSTVTTKVTILLMVSFFILLSCLFKTGRQRRSDVPDGGILEVMSGH